MLGLALVASVRSSLAADSKSGARWTTPAVLAEGLGGFDARTGDVRDDARAPTPSPQADVVVALAGFIGITLLAG
ncbi:hypothetical protein FM076_00375 [Streptomyces albus subsp. chlorinus]|uniref:hypothetical protein n=1 Tax=Streptomyces albus TaxID=1888 RepID=UPI00156FACB0|nr:hypothetical protein [Streptomyces albus]NSC19763.1 hypothetical protein [Streptomyces albus subsp. chlorinus]